LILFVFDIDDTISETALIHQQFFIEVLQEMGVQKMNTDFGSYKHHTDSYIAKQIFEGDRNEAFNSEKLCVFENKMLLKMERVIISEVRGAVSFLKSLSIAKDVCIAFATGAVRKTAEYKLNLLGIPFNDKMLVASNNIEDREGIVSKAISNAKELNNIDEFEKIYSFGDGVWDFKTAKNLNIEFVGIGKRNKEAILELGSVFHFDDFQSDRIIDTLN
jgi:phosphoglycolate phosphatase-like HAD superfamily hydrolase